jgi:hypothetical protein
VYGGVSCIWYVVVLCREVFHQSLFVSLFTKKLEGDRSSQVSRPSAGLNSIVVTSKPPNIQGIPCP